MGSLKNILVSALPLVAAVISPLLGLTGIAAALFVGGAAVAGSMLTSIENSSENPLEMHINTRTTQRIVPVIYGERKVGGNDVFIGMTGEGSDDMWIVQALSEGICEGIGNGDAGDKRIFIDGMKLSDKKTKASGEPPMDELVTWWVHNGNPNQSSPSSEKTTGGNYTVNKELNKDIKEFTDRMPYTCYIVFKIKYNNKVFSGIPTREIVLKGIKPKNVFSGGSSYSNNPVVILYDYISNSRYGLGWEDSVLDLNKSWKKAYQYCNGKWEISFVIGQKVKAIHIIENILKYFRGELVWDSSLGKLKLLYKDTPLTPILSIDDSDIAQDGLGHALISVNQPTINNSPRGAIVKYIDKSDGWVVDDIPFGEEDGKILDLDLTGFADKTMALSMTKYLVERMQDTRSYSVTLRPNNIALEVGDIVSFSSTEIGMAKQTMRIIKSDISPDLMSNVVMISERESIYDDVYLPLDFKVYDTGVADPDLPPGPVREVNFRESSRVDRNRTCFDLEVYFESPNINIVYYKYTKISIVVLEHGETFFDRFKKPVHEVYFDEFISTRENKFVINNVSVDDTYYIRFRTVNDRNVMQPIYVEKELDKWQQALVISYDIKGYETLPLCPGPLSANVSVFSTIALFALAPTITTDIVEYEFRLGASEHSSWEDSIYLITQPRPAVSYTGVKPGTHLFMVNSVRDDGVYGGCTSNPPRVAVDMERPAPFHKVIQFMDINHEHVEGPAVSFSYQDMADTSATTNTIFVGESFAVGSPTVSGGSVGECHYETKWMRLDNRIDESHESPITGIYLNCYILLDYEAPAVIDRWNEFAPTTNTTWADAASNLSEDIETMDWDFSNAGDGRAAKVNLRLKYSSNSSGTPSVSLGQMELLSGTVRGDGQLYVKLIYDLIDNEMKNNTYSLTINQSAVVLERRL